MNLRAALAAVLAWRPSLRIITRENNTPYLRRWALRRQARDGTNERRVYLHNFLTPDGDGHHNHPWTWSFSLILWGSYTEEYFTRTPPDCTAAARDGWCDNPLHTEYRSPVRTRTVRWFNWLPPGRYHRIVALHGSVWTLFFCGPLTGKGWGFWMPGRGHVPWKERLAERGLAP